MLESYQWALLNRFIKIPIQGHIQKHKDSIQQATRT